MNKTVASALLAGGVILGGFGAVSVASAESSDTVTQTDPASENNDAQDNNAGFLNVQDTDGADTTEGDEARAERSERKGRKLAVAAETIGIEVDELRTALQDGQTIGEIADANGVDADTVIDAMVDALSERLDEKVANGDITEEEAAEKLAEKSERISNKVNGIDEESA